MKSLSINAEVQPQPTASLDIPLSPKPGQVNTPHIISALDNTEQAEILMDYIGPSIEEWTAGSGAGAPKRNHLSEKDILDMATDIVNSLQGLHDKNYSHCDLKPANICLSHSSDHIKRQYYLIDFGLAKKFNLWEPHLQDDIFQGNVLFASNAQIMGYIARPKDDLESLMYVCYYLLNDYSLPWLSKETSTMPFKS
jgi:serine/threonine protein kinase